MDTNAKWEMYGSVWRWLLVGLLVLPLIGVGYMGANGMLDNTNHGGMFPAASWVFIPLGFAGVFKCLAQLATIRRPMLTLSPAGITLPAEFDGVLAWRDVVDIAELDLSTGPKSMRIVASEGFVAKQRPSLFRKVIGAFNSLVKLPGYYVTSQTGTRSHAELGEALQAYHQAHHPDNRASARKTARMQGHARAFA